MTYIQNFQHNKNSNFLFVDLSVSPTVWPKELFQQITRKQQR